MAEYISSRLPEECVVGMLWLLLAPATGVSSCCNALWLARQAVDVHAQSSGTRRRLDSW